MELDFRGEIWYWRGPAPFYFVWVPEEQCELLRAVSRFVTYGWGMIPVKVSIGGSQWETSLFPKEGRYLVPVKASIRKAENLGHSDAVHIRLSVAGIEG